MKRAFLLAFAALCAVLPLSGCTLAAYGLGVGAMVEDMKQREREGYASYRRKVEADNTVRAQKGLPPQPVLSLQAWRAAEGN